MITNKTNQGHKTKQKQTNNTKRNRNKQKQTKQTNKIETNKPTKLKQTKQKQTNKTNRNKQKQIKWTLCDNLFPSFPNRSGSDRLWTSFSPFPLSNGRLRTSTILGAPVGMILGRVDGDWSDSNPGTGTYLSAHPTVRLSGFSQSFHKYLMLLAAGVCGHFTKRRCLCCVGYWDSILT